MQDQDWNRDSVDITTVINYVMKTVGIVIVVIGVVFLFSITKQIWELFENPNIVKDFAMQIEKESNVDKFTYALIIELLNKQEKTIAPDENQQPNNQPVANNLIQREQIKISYFAAWIFKILLLLVITKIALWMIREGGIIARKEKENKALIASVAKEMCSDIFKEMEARRNQ
ncbi:hypothetical protein [Candidatus Uabimicrobium sp. HlEnr_7]|uniref:hypothetical protein n=1 Tax=Candidatus Uabimicrobium helgolandensis TaxID=3095367 RepID=UPI00355739D4